MNDYWNDPPEEPDREELDCEELELPTYDTLEEYRMEEERIRAEPEKCPHGKEWGLCDRCDYEGDIAYDAWREKH